MTEDKPMITTVRKFVRRADIMRPHFVAIECALADATPNTGEFASVEFEAQRLIENFGFAAGIYDKDHLPTWRGKKTTIEQVRAEWMRLQDVKFDIRRVAAHIQNTERVKENLRRLQEIVETMPSEVNDDEVPPLPFPPIRGSDEADEVRWRRYIR